MKNNFEKFKEDLSFSLLNKLPAKAGSNRTRSVQTTMTPGKPFFYSVTYSIFNHSGLSCNDTWLI